MLTMTHVHEYISLFHVGVHTLPSLNLFHLNFYHSPYYVYMSGPIQYTTYKYNIFVLSKKKSITFLTCPAFAFPAVYLQNYDE